MARAARVSLLLLGLWGCAREDSPGVEHADHPGSSTPVLAPMQAPPEHQQGETLFAAHCQVCHGVQAGGSEVGPPLVHRTYEPNHHADFSFIRAVEFGVRAHHWRFGDMPPVADVARDDAVAIVGYVRWLQRRAGIY